MNIGIPNESLKNENRVSLTPSAAATLSNLGHALFVESQAGKATRFSDESYRNAGATVVYSKEEVYRRCELICAVEPPTLEEIRMMEAGQTSFSFLNLPVARQQFVEEITRKQITTIGYELVETEDGDRPVIHSMSEIAGQIAIQVSERYLESTGKEGRGILLGGITGVAPAAVVILGAGVVGTTAARSALGRGAQVIVIDNDLQRLRKIDYNFRKKVTTVMANPYTISRGVKFADVLIGAVLIKGEKAPHIVTEEMVKQMKTGSVIVDVSIDQGGCIETSRITTLSDPVFIQHNVIHYCVPNMPALVPRTASYGLNNAALKYIQDIAENGLGDALINDPGLSKGVCTYKGYVSNEAIAGVLDLEYRRLRVFSRN